MIFSTTKELDYPFHHVNIGLYQQKRKACYDILQQFQPVLSVKLFQADLLPDDTSQS